LTLLWLSVRFYQEETKEEQVIMGKRRGKVYLVGAGPGDPSLITLRGIEVLRKAEVVIYDYLANQQLLNYTSEGTELIYAGKQGPQHTLSQEEIIQLLISKAKEGKMVVRLKGGDPFVFGRGGEEGEKIAEAGIELEVVPGVTSAIAVPAYAGIPLTHRDYTSTAAIITGHEDPHKEGSQIRWDKIATGIGTLVFLMGISNLGSIVTSLLENGRDPHTPAAVIRWGTTNQQRTIVGTLSNIVQKVEEENLRPPAILIVGEVVSLREKLNWFENKPLWQKRILVTRSREQASSLAELLEDHGAQVIQFPTIQIHPPADWADLDQAITELSDYQWIIFTSANGVQYFWQRLSCSQRDARALAGLKIAAIGAATAQELEKHGIVPDLLPQEYKAEGLIEALGKEELTGKKILIPRAAEARDVLPVQLQRLGAQVRVVEAYRTLRPEDGHQQIIKLLKDKAIDIITFTSSSTVKNLMDMLPEEERQRLLSGIKIACIGPITAQTVRDYGIHTDIMPAEYTINALVEAIIQHIA